MRAGAVGAPSGVCVKHSILLVAVLVAAPLGATEVDGSAEALLWKGGPDSGGIGARGALRVDAFFADALIQTGERGDVDVDHFRAGIGLIGQAAPGIFPFAQAEVVHIGVDGGENENGVGLHGGLRWRAAPTITIVTRVGIVDVGELEASEFVYGGSWDVAWPFSLVLERSETVLGTETRFGGRFNFGFAAAPQPGTRPLRVRLDSP